MFGAETVEDSAMSAMKPPHTKGFTLYRRLTASPWRRRPAYRRYDRVLTAHHTVLNFCVGLLVLL